LGTVCVTVAPPGYRQVQRPTDTGKVFLAAMVNR
jgi:hypothetical protein